MNIKILVIAATAACAILGSLPAHAQTNCAVKVGTYEGPWQTIGTGVLQVISVDSKCVATVTYGIKGRQSSAPFAIDASKAFTIACGGNLSGTCAFTRKGDVLEAAYSDPHKNTNKAIFKQQ